MQTKIITFLLLLHLVVVVKTELCTCPGYIIYYATDSTIYTSSRGTPSQTDFYNHLHSTVAELVSLFKQCSSFLIITNMTVNVSCESTEVGQLCNSSIHQFSWTHHWYEDNFVSVIRELIKSKSFYRSNHYISPDCTKCTSV